MLCFWTDHYFSARACTCVVMSNLWRQTAQAQAQVQAQAQAHAQHRHNLKHKHKHRHKHSTGTTSNTRTRTSTGTGTSTDTGTEAQSQSGTEAQATRDSEVYLMLGPSSTWLWFNYKSFECNTLHWHSTTLNITHAQKVALGFEC